MFNPNNFTTLDYLLLIDRKANIIRIENDGGIHKKMVILTEEIGEISHDIDQNLDTVVSECADTLSVLFQIIEHYENNINAIVTCLRSESSYSEKFNLIELISEVMDATDVDNEREIHEKITGLSIHVGRMSEAIMQHDEIDVIINALVAVFIVIEIMCCYEEDEYEIVYQMKRSAEKLY